MRRTLLLLFVISYSLFTAPVHAQWEPLNLPTYLNIKTFAAIGDTLFADTYILDNCGIFRTTNNGVSWRGPLGNSLDSNNALIVMSLKGAIGDTLYATQLNGIRTASTYAFYSTDLGEKWDTVKIFGRAMRMYGFVVNAGVICAETDSGRACSTDNGAHWWVAQDSIGMPSVITSDGATVYAVAGNYKNKLYRTTDRGAHWEYAGTIVSDSIAQYTEGTFSLFAAGGNLYAGIILNGIYRSSDSGVTWSRVLRNDSDHIVGKGIQFAISNGTLFAGMYSGVYRSTDNGLTWAALNNSVFDTMPVGAIAIVESNIFAGTSVSSWYPPFSGVYRSSDGGSNWVPVNTGLFSNLEGYFLPHTALYPFAVNGKNVFAGSRIWDNMDESSIYRTIRSTDNGISWNSLSPNEIDALVEEKGTLIAGEAGQPYIGGGDVICSTDEGDTWTSCDTSLSNLVSVSEEQGASDIQIHGDTLFVVANVYGNGKVIRLYRSTDGGASWTEADSGLPSDFTITSMAFIGGKAFLGTWNGLYHSTNNGDFWIADTAQGKVTIGAVALKGLELFKTVDSMVYSSPDGGLSWASVANIVGLPGGLLDMEMRGRIVFALTTRGAYLTTDSGAVWKIIDSTTSGYPFGSLAVNDSFLFAEINGISRRPLSDFGINAVNEKPTNLPAQFSLQQNYPNPFSGMTNVEFRIPNEEQVTLNVYNALGKEVATLAQVTMSAGTHSVQLSGESLQNGIYFYRLSAGKSVQTGKMIVVK